MSKQSKSSINMTPLLENDFILTRTMNRRYAKATYQKYHNKWQITTFIISVVLFSLAFVSAFLSKFCTVLVILFPIFILIGFYCFFMSWFGYLFQAHVSYKDMARFYGDPIHMHVIFYDRFIRVVGDDNNFDFPYEYINEIIDLGDMSILMINSPQSIKHGQVIDKSILSPDELATYYEIIYKIQKNKG